MGNKDIYLKLNLTKVAINLLLLFLPVYSISVNGITPATNTSNKNPGSHL